MIGERIKELRQTLGSNQQKFGAKIGMSQTAIAKYEADLREPPETVILSIIREYGCSETWLRTGEGEMFPDLTWQTKVAAYVGRVLTEAGAGAELQQAALDFFATVPPEIWDVMGEKAKEVLDRHFPEK